MTSSEYCSSIAAHSLNLKKSSKLLTHASLDEVLIQVLNVSVDTWSYFQVVMNLLLLDEGERIRNWNEDDNPGDTPDLSMVAACTIHTGICIA